MKRKTVLLAFLNAAAAIAVGIGAGLLYKYYFRSDGMASRDDMKILSDKIAALSAAVDAKVGVAAIFSTADTLVTSSDEFPMMSVMKFHQALAVAAWLRQNRVPLDAEVEVTPDMLPGGTWSPMRDSFPQGGSFSYRELLRYSLEYSDNNACDILFSLSGGPERTDSYIRSLGIDGFGISCTEAMMHKEPGISDRNRTTPLSAALLLEKFWNMRDEDPYSRFIWETMASCRTGMTRIPGHIASKASAIAHKTGTGDVTPEGRIAAVNDIGIVVLPDGSRFSLAVFISDAGCTPEQCESLIAGIAAVVYERAASAMTEEDVETRD